MELEEMQNIWENKDEMNKIIPFQISDVSLVEYRKKTYNFKAWEIFGLTFAYMLAGFVVFTFGRLDEWYLRLCGTVLIVYLIVMPLYTLFATWKLKHMDLVNPTCKEILEQLYITKSILNKAEKISFIASPFLFAASVVIFTKLFTGKNIFTINFQLPVIILIGIAFFAGIYLNVWAFKKRDIHFTSVKKLLEDGN